MISSLGGCTAASMPWRHPDLPKDQWSRDYYACRREADRDSGWRDDDSSGPLREYDRQQAKKIYNGSLSACMTGLGYVHAPKN